MLKFEQVSHEFQRGSSQIEALQDVSFELPEGQMVAIQGPSGSGKSTLLTVAGGMRQPRQGRVILAGQDLYSLNTSGLNKIRATQLGFIFQEFHLVPYLDVRRNILLSSLMAPIDQADQRAETLMEQLGLSDRADHLPGRLSVGECQRVAIARAMLFRPNLILADEPTGNLDRDNSTVVMQALKDISAQGTSVLLVTHDTEAANWADEQWQLCDGQLEKQGVQHAVSV